MAPPSGVEVLVPDRAAWHDWLVAHHASEPAAWLVLTKKGGTVTALTYADALDEALCFGWIDGQGRRRDEGSVFQRFTPRTARSRWSATNVGHVERLEREGRMTDAGRAAVAAAKADGRWEAAYAAPSQAVLPDDLLAAVAAVPAAQEMLDVLSAQNRFALYHRLGAIKRPQTRARRIEEYVAMLARHETIHPQRQRPSAAPDAPE
jgi:uncharacterized protein YdeI (YjbR/CyaY-like superfamily)